jgi:hypothetical protein
MPRIDDYINARNLAAEALSQESFEKLAQRSGFEPLDGQSLLIPFLNRTYLVRYPQFDFTDQVDSEKEVPIQEQVLILHYLMAAEIPDSSGQWVSYREIPGASFYYGPFVKRAVEPLKKVFGQNIAAFSRAAEKLQARIIKNGDAGFELRTLPAVPLQLILWEGDDEFPAEANILFDKTIGRILSPEDIAWLAGMVVYRMIALSR